MLWSIRKNNVATEFIRIIFELVEIAIILVIKTTVYFCVELVFS